FLFLGNKKPLLIARWEEATVRAALLIFPGTFRAGFGTWTLESLSNRLPWFHRARPFTTRNETVVSTDTDRMMDAFKCVNMVLPFVAFALSGLIW
ncbi:MAG: hypothetical protein JWM99_4298, partial [Verrucomicrobiales bacterium]|nr:hypothetical protein [Verrucomicrobiales bacterium]